MKRDFIVLAKSGSLNQALSISLIEWLRLISYPRRVLRDWISSELCWMRNSLQMGEAERENRLLLNYDIDHKPA